MTVSELKNIITANVYENTSGAITGGVLQDVLLKAAAGLIGISTSQLTSNANDILKEMGSRLYARTDIVTALAGNSTFASNFATNSTFASNLAGSPTFVSYLAGNSTFAWELSTSSKFSSAMMYSNMFSLAASRPYQTGTLAQGLIDNTDFISRLKSALGI